MSQNERVQNERKDPDWMSRWAGTKPLLPEEAETLKRVGEWIAEEGSNPMANPIWVMSMNIAYHGTEVPDQYDRAESAYRSNQENSKT